MILGPRVQPSLGEVVWSAAPERLDQLALDGVETLLRDDDEEGARFARIAGFEPTDDRGGDMWMAAAARPGVPPLQDGFVLVDRARTGTPPHWLAARNGPSVEDRLRQIPLYDPELDLAILAPSGDVAGARSSGSTL